MKVVAVIGTGGGAGTTAVAANLSAAFASQKRHTLALDLCMENILRLHFGMPYDDSTGFVEYLLQGKQWSDAAYRSAGGHEFIPFGQIPEDDLDALADMLKDDPNWLRKQLAKLELPDGTMVVCDCPRMPKAVREQAMLAADLVLMVAAPDSVSFAAINRLAGSIERPHGPPALLVLNRFDAARQLDRDIAVLMRIDHAPIFSPVVIHADESVPEALACKQTIFEFAPASQAAYDFLALATWLIARLGHAPQAT